MFITPAYRILNSGMVANHKWLKTSGITTLLPSCEDRTLFDLGVMGQMAQRIRE